MTSTRATSLAPTEAAAISAYGIEEQVSRPTPMIAGKWLAVGGLASLMIVASLLHATSLDVDSRATASLAIYGCAAMMMAMWWRCRARASKAESIARDFAESLIAFAFVSLLGTVASYPVMALSHGFSDAVLAESDRLMQFNWVGWYEVTEAHPLLQVTGRLSYKFIFISPPVLLGYFAWTGRKAEARQFIAAFWLAAVITLSIALFVPAQGPLVYLWHGVVDYVPSAAFDQADLIPLLRAHRIHLIEPGALRGLVSAPSFHTASAVIFMATAWRFRRIRGPVVAVNLAMLLATVVEGTHYLTDMLTGAIVASFSVAAIGALASWLDPDSAVDETAGSWPVGAIET